MDGVLVIDKARGPTSHDVVARVRRATGVKRVGHTGTLDPIASGVLALVLGRAARLSQFLINTEKEYETEIRLGLETDTYDLTGQSVGGSANRRPIEDVSRERIEQVLSEFRGSYLQQPPPFSAKKIGGRRAYALARRGTPVQPSAAPVAVSRLELAGWQPGLLKLWLICSAGFYVRSLAHDLGDRLGTGACVQTLRRLRSGDFRLDRAVPLEALERDPTRALAHVVPISKLLPSLPGVVLTSEGARRAARGNLISAAHLLEPLALSAARVRLLDEGGHLIAIAEPAMEPGLLHPAIVVG